MTTPYADVDDWADTKGYSNGFAAYIADDNPWPTEDKLTPALEKATRILNNRKHLNCGTTNISDTNYTADIKDYCISIANRMMDVDRNRGQQGGLFTFSPQDFLYTYEREDILNISFELGYRKVGGVG